MITKQTMNKENFNPHKQHKLLVVELNKMYPNFFRIREEMISGADVHKEISKVEACNLAELTSRIFNMYGGSVGDIDLYKLFEVYFVDLEKRKKINEIIHG